MLGSKAFKVDKSYKVKHNGMAIVGIILYSDVINYVVIKIDGITAIAQAIDEEETIYWGAKIFLRQGQELVIEADDVCNVVLNYDGD